jgi:alkylation response protein AidB-like acyl-CoA dehydrogenase
MQPWEDPELDAIREAHRAFAAKELQGDFALRDREGEVSPERWKAAADFGVLGICMPREYGGQGRPVSHAVAAFEGLGQGCQDGGFIYALCSQLLGVQMALRLCAGPELLRLFLPRLIQGEVMSAHCFTEQSSGSDAFSMETFAKQDGDHFILNGAKCFVTNAPHSDVGMVFAKTMPGRNPLGLTTFMVDMRWPGARHGRTFQKMGMRTVHMGELIFEDVRVPKSHVVGRVGRGLDVLGESTGYERALLLTTALGPMARAVEACVKRARERRQFDKPIGAFQGVSSRVANMIMRQRLSRLAIYDIATKLKDGISIGPHAQDAAITKLFVSDAFIQTELDAMQIFGVRGYLLENFPQQDLRDALSSTIWAGTDETLRNTIAKLAGLPVG